jgi:hypothetical protein
MTTDQLSAIRARLDAARQTLQGVVRVEIHGDVLVTLLNETERLTNDLRVLTDEVERLINDLALARQVSGELCEACGWAMKFPGEMCRCELLKEVERLTADPLPAAAWVREVERAAFARGAEAMRTALLQRVSWGSDLADRIRAEPVPEDK